MLSFVFQLIFVIDEANYMLLFGSDYKIFKDNKIMS